MTYRTPRLGVHVPGDTENHLARILSLPVSYVTYAFPLDGSYDTDSITTTITALLEAGVQPLIHFRSNRNQDYPAQSVIQTALDTLPAGTTYFLLENELRASGFHPARDIESYFASGGYYDLCRDTIFGTFPDAKISPAALADGAMTEALNGEPEGSRLVELTVAADAEFLVVHHHSLPQNLFNWWKFLPKAKVPIHIQEGGYPDPQAYGVIVDRDGIDALVEANYQRVGMGILNQMRCAVWYHATLVDNDKGDRLDMRGLWRSDGVTKNPAYGEFIAVSRRLWETTSHTPFMDPRIIPRRRS